MAKLNRGISKCGKFFVVDISDGEDECEDFLEMIQELIDEGDLGTSEMNAIQEMDLQKFLNFVEDEERKAELEYEANR
tara:strand:+ start:1457 stop:1690 length:234 start_codon:yes stop_codon:yes gene_type:complete